MAKSNFLMDSSTSKPGGGGLTSFLMDSSTSKSGGDFVPSSGNGGAPYSPFPGYSPPSSSSPYVPPGRNQDFPSTFGVDPRLYEFSDDERASVRSAIFGLLSEGLSGHGPLGFGMGGFGGGGGFSGGGGGGGGVSAGHASASLAEASLIDLNDDIYSLIAPKAWMSQMLSRGKDYTNSAVEDSLRQMSDQAGRQGISQSSPAYQYMVTKQRRDQQQALAAALRDANLAWTLPAAERRGGALAQNSQLSTNVSMTNAELQTRISEINAQLATQASIARGQLAEAAASRRAQASQFAASLGRSNMMDLFSIMRYINDPSANMQFINTPQQQQGGGWRDVLGDIGAFLGPVGQIGSLIFGSHGGK